MHAGRQDVAILRRTLDTEVRNVFDTQVAAGFLGFGNQEGYESLVRKVLRVKLKGSEGFTRWDRRPLTPQQLEYAADDARLLLALGEELERRLEERGRLEWAREESRALEEVSDERDAQRSYERLPRLGRLSEAARGGGARAGRVARGGGALSRPRRRAPCCPTRRWWSWPAARPRDKHGLEQIRGLPPQTLHRRGDALLAAIERGRERRGPPAPPEPPPREPADAPLVSLAQALVRHRSMESGVAVELIATQSELAALVSCAAPRRGRRPHARGNGWRRELVGDELRELVEGRRALSVGPDGGLASARCQAGRHERPPAARRRRSGGGCRRFASGSGTRGAGPRSASARAGRPPGAPRRPRRPARGRGRRSRAPGGRRRCGSRPTSPCRRAAGGCGAPRGAPGRGPRARATTAPAGSSRSQQLLLERLDRLVVERRAAEARHGLGHAQRVRGADRRRAGRPPLQHVAGEQVRARPQAVDPLLLELGVERLVRVLRRLPGSAAG